MLVLKTDDLPADVKELLSRLQPNDKVTIENATFHLVENGEKVVSFAIQDGDSITFKADPNTEQSVTVKMGDTEEDITPGVGESDEEETKSPAVESMKAGMYEPDVPA